MLSPKNTIPTWVPILFFGLYLLLGLLIFDDYGISWDEHLERNHGLVSLDYVNQQFGNFLGEERFSEKYELLSYRDRDHGHTFSIVTYLIEMALGLEDIRDWYLMRHLCTFLLFWWSSILFFRLTKIHFENGYLALWLSGFMLLSPRIFADSFFNAKDAIFLSLFIVSSYTMIRFFEQPGFWRALLFALATAFLISMRVLGVVIPVLAIGFCLFAFLSGNWGSVLRKTITPLLFYLMASAFFTVAIWPFLWEAPIENFLFVFKSLSNYNWGGDVRYFNEFIKATELPWHYTLGWIAVSTPLLYSLLFLLGIWPVMAGIFTSLFKHTSGFFEDKRALRRSIFLSLFFVPLAAVIILKSTLYDAWRQLFFIYPTFLIMAGEGLMFIYDQIQKQIENSVLRRKIVNGGIWVIALSLSWIAFDMIRNHPHQNVYFNVAAGNNVAIRFDGDYWGLANRQVLEQILKMDNRELIKINASNWSAIANRDILLPEQRKRIKYVSYKEADYFVSNHRDWRNFYRFRDQKNPFDKPVYELKVNGNVFAGAYRAEGELKD